jgi:UDP-glucose 4-epimerase
MSRQSGYRSVRCGPPCPPRGTLHLVPASPQLFDAVLRLPIMDVTRARTELGWSPRYSALDAMQALLDGLRDGAGMDTPPLARATGGPLRLREFLTGVGGRP